VPESFGVMVERMTDIKRANIAPHVREGLETRGVETVRVLLVTSAGPGLGSIVEGLTDTQGKWVSRADAEAWLNEQKAIEDHTARQRQTLMLRWTGAGVVAAVIAAVAGIIAAWEGWH